jgi:phosphoribosylformimino-5-aminoimidazole carboxamide ribotide isomerase
VKGWEEASPLDLPGAIALAREAGTSHVLVTAIDRDGTFAGPSIDLVREALDLAPGGVVAAGGIGKLDDIRAVLDLRHPRLEGVVAGRALYEGRLDLRAAVDLSKEYRT